MQRLTAPRKCMHRPRIRVGEVQRPGGDVAFDAQLQQGDLLRGTESPGGQRPADDLDGLGVPAGPGEFDRPELRLFPRAVRDPLARPLAVASGLGGAIAARAAVLGVGTPDWFHPDRRRDGDVSFHGWLASTSADSGSHASTSGSDGAGSGDGGGGGSGAD